MRISILTPTRNAGRWLPECIESVRQQRGDAAYIEHVIIDGASTDDTVAIARDSGVRVLEVGESGIYFKLNIGVEQASGDVIGYLAGDDLLLPGAIRAINKWFERGRNPILVGGIRWTDCAGQSRGDLAAPPSWMTSEMYASLGWSCMQTTSVFVRKEFIEELGGYDESFVYSGDYEFFARALARSSFDRVSRSLSVWRMHCESLSNDETGAFEEELVRIQAAFAPTSSTKRTAYRLMLKIWLNGRSPRWFLHKRVPRLRLPVDANYGRVDREEFSGSTRMRFEGGDDSEFDELDG